MHYLILCLYSHDSRSTQSALKNLEDIVERLDAEEDRNVLFQKEYELIDEFDNEPPATVPNQSLEIPSIIPSQEFVCPPQIDVKKLNNNNPVLSITNTSVTDRFSNIFTTNDSITSNNVAITESNNPSYGVVPSISYKIDPPSLEEWNSDSEIKGLNGIRASDLQVVKLTLQYCRSFLFHFAIHSKYIFN